MDVKSCPALSSAQKMVSVTHYRDIEEILRRTSEFVIGDTKSDSHEFLAGSITTMDGPAHVARRRLLGRAVDIRQPWGPGGSLFDELFERNMEQMRTGQPSTPIKFNLVEFARRTVWETVCRMLGIDDVDRPERAAVLQALAGSFVNAATVEFTLGDHAAAVDAGRDALAQVRQEFFEPSYQRRLALVEQSKSDTTVRLPGDLITTMILAGEGDPDSALILRETMVFFTASINNPVNQTPFALEDLERWLLDHPEDLQRLDDDNFYSRCVQETLRLHRTGNPYLVRRAANDTELKSGLRLNKGDRVALYIGVANLEEEVWGPDAAQFDPYREIPTGLSPFGLAFGAGAHMCIGRPLLVFEQGNPIKMGMQARMLKSLVKSGVRPDPDGERVKAPHAADRYSQYGVLLGRPLASA